MVSPLGLVLTGRRVIAVGGGPVSARRVAAFLEDGAEVTVITPELCEDLRDLVDAGAVTWVPRDYAGARDLDGAWLVHTASGEPATDAAVAADAEAARIFCVDAALATRGSAMVPARAAVDTPAGRVQVGIHGGADPKRALAVRDAVVPAMRRAAHEVLHTGGADLRSTRPSTGWVALVGGGPGEEGLLTSRALVLLSAADVVVTDRLAPTGVLATLRPGVRVINVGKAPGHHAMPQERINDVIVEEALAGHGVVRLKGGDPYVLGRGGEERAVCEAAGVPVEVVSGVTSAIAVPAAAGIPVTHRGLARGFTVVTGHDDLPHVPVAPGHTLVMLMGVSRLRENLALLMARGADADRPAAVIERGLSPEQRVTTATLGTLAEVAERAGVASPAVVVIGEVVTLSPHWA